MKPILIIALSLFLGCDINEERFFSLRTIEGHRYITYSNGYGVCIIHAESCRCKGETK